jgi:hypothetical protein
MVNGNSVKLQIGEESSYATIADATEQIKISSESLKAAYNKVDEGLATGGRGAGRVQTMGIGVEGAFSTLLRPDMGLLLKLLLGVEGEIVDNADGSYKHTFTAIGTGLNDLLPSASIRVDRVVSAFVYNGCKVNQISFSAAAGDYVKADITVAGRTESAGTLTAGVSPSPRKAFRFAGGKCYKDNLEIADITSMTVDYNNNLDSQTQTTSTGDYYAEPECGTREISVSLEMLYSASVEAIREAVYKTDDTFSISLTFESDEEIAAGVPYALKISIPCCQCSEADANMGGLETLKQSLTINAVDNLSDELITFELTNDRATTY